MFFLFWPIVIAGPICFLFAFYSALTKSFRFFLQQEFSEENLDFWLEIEKYRKDKTNRQQRANKIFQTFVQVESPKEVRGMF